MIVVVALGILLFGMVLVFIGMVWGITSRDKMIAQSAVDKTPMTICGKVVFVKLVPARLPEPSNDAGRKNEC